MDGCLTKAERFKLQMDCIFAILIIILIIIVTKLCSDILRKIYSDVLIRINGGIQINNGLIDQ